MEKAVTSLICNMEGFDQSVCVEERLPDAAAEDFIKELEKSEVPIFYMNRPEDSADRTLPVRC
jgi:hypothetical protein